MGGCRCTYSNCTSRTEAKLHFFHYPVFDKVRCLQWLKNARRFDFLKLTVSQLKNRVVCHHHFQDIMFMNYKRDKLIHMAVPTENGPNCTNNIIKKEDDDPFIAFINELLLENNNDFQDNFATTKRTYMSLKYMDFVTNGETMDLDTENLIDSSHANIIGSKEDKPILENKELSKKNLNKKTSLLAPEPVVLQNNASNIYLDMEKSKNALQYVQMKDSLKQKCNKEEIFDDINEALKAQNAIFIEVPPLGDINKYDIVQQSDSINKPKCKIDIISEETVSIPLPVDTGKMMNVTPSFVLHMPENKAKQGVIVENDSFNQFNVVIEENLPKDTKDSIQKSQLITLEDIIQLPPVSDEAKEKETEDSIQKSQLISLEDIIQLPPVADDAKEMQIAQTDADNFSTNIQLNRIKSKRKEMKHNTSETNMAKNKICITPERVAVIEEKRRFNMKLRDIIEAGLNKLEENENDVKNIVKPISIPQVKNRRSRVEQYNMLGLEHRMKRLEDNLLHRIDHNTQKILELKKLFLSDSSADVDKSRRTRSISVQSVWSNEDHKNNLFKEISPYISTELKSMLFEELFLSEHKKLHEPDVCLKRRSKRRKL